MHLQLWRLTAVAAIASACLFSGCGGPNYFFESHARKDSKLTPQTAIFVDLQEQPDSIDVEGYHRLRNAMRAKGFHVVEDYVNAEAILTFDVNERHKLRRYTYDPGVFGYRYGIDHFFVPSNPHLYIAQETVCAISVAVFDLAEFFENVAIVHAVAADSLPEHELYNLHLPLWYGVSSIRPKTFKKFADELAEDLFEYYNRTEDFEKKFWRSRDPKRHK